MRISVSIHLDGLPIQDNVFQYYEPKYNKQWITTPWWTVPVNGISVPFERWVASYLVMTCLLTFGCRLWRLLANHILLLFVSVKVVLLFVNLKWWWMVMVSKPTWSRGLMFEYHFNNWIIIYGGSVSDWIHMYTCGSGTMWKMHQLYLFCLRRVHVKI